MSATVGGPLAFKYFPSQFWRPSGVNTEFDPARPTPRRKISARC